MQTVESAIMFELLRHALGRPLVTDESSRTTPPNESALGCEPQCLRGSFEAPKCQRQTLPWGDWNALWLVSCGALLGSAPLRLSHRERLHHVLESRHENGLGSGRPRAEDHCTEGTA